MFTQLINIKDYRYARLHFDDAGDHASSGCMLVMHVHI